ncbi:MAG TPA: hypothetical protein VI585_02815 [Candidatus Binatia bacterium]
MQVVNFPPNWDFPELKPRMPWYGYSLGAWTPEDEAEAEVALRGDHFATGEKAKNHRVKT